MVNSRPKRVRQEVEKKRPLPIPTRHLPGTKAKIKILALRYCLGQELHHPNDAKRNLD